MGEEGGRGAGAGQGRTGQGVSSRPSSLQSLTDLGMNRVTKKRKLQTQTEARKLLKGAATICPGTPRLRDLAVYSEARAPLRRNGSHATLLRNVSLRQQTETAAQNAWQGMTITMKRPLM